VLAIGQPLQFPKAETYPPGAAVYDGTPTRKLQRGETPDVWPDSRGMLQTGEACSRAMLLALFTFYDTWEPDRSDEQ
jgi:hypothetical protein